VPEQQWIRPFGPKNKAFNVMVSCVPPALGATDPLKTSRKPERWNLKSKRHIGNL
jgi:hypothetical protein